MKRIETSRSSNMLGVLLGLAFLLSAGIKAADIGSFAEQIPYYGVVQTPGAANGVAWATVAVEAGLGIALLLRRGRRWFLTAAFALLAGFTGLILYAWAFRGLAECGCFGELIPMTPGVSVAKNVLMMAAIPFAGLRGRRQEVDLGRVRRFTRLKVFLLGCVTGSLLVVVLALAAVASASSLFRDSISRQIEKRLQPLCLPGTLGESGCPLKTLEGADYDMLATRGKAVFLTFFSSTCSPCLAQLPGIDRLYTQLAGANVAFLCVAVKDSKDLRNMLKTKGYSFPVYILSGERPAPFKTATIPATFILSPDGTVAFAHVGPAKWDDQSCVAFLKKLGQEGRHDDSESPVSTPQIDSPASTLRTALSRSANAAT